MAFSVKKRGRITYYFQGKMPTISSLVTEETKFGDLKMVKAEPLNRKRFTVHVADFPDKAASYEFCGVGLYQKPI